MKGRQWWTHEATLFVGPVYSSCGSCWGLADPNEKTHITRGDGEGCGTTFVRVSSDYGDRNGLYQRIRETRPDLPFVDWFDVPDRTATCGSGYKVRR